MWGVARSPGQRTPWHDADDGDEQEEGGQEPSGAAGPEPAEPDRSAATPLLDQQGGDEEHREHEEGVHAEEAPGTERSPVWKAMMASTDTARTPSSPRMWPSVGLVPGALASVLMLRPTRPPRGGVPSVPYWGNVLGSRASLPQARQARLAPMTPPC